MSKLGTYLSGAPIAITDKIYFYQPTLQQIMEVGEATYWSLLKIWDLSKEEMMGEKASLAANLTDFDVWTAYNFGVDDFRLRVIQSVDLFLHTKIEFLPISNTIMIGEGDSLILLESDLYEKLQGIIKGLMDIISAPKENEQYKETDQMSEREKQLVAKMKKSAERLERIKNGDKQNEDRLVKQIVSLVAIGHYTFDEVYKMTLIQMIVLLKKYAEIQQYELITALSPYMDSKKGQGVKHWLDT